MNIKVLGPGCANCGTLERRTLDALGELNIPADVEQVTDLEGILSYGVLRTPGLVIDGALVWRGGVPAVDKLKELITANATARP